MYSQKIKAISAVVDNYFEGVFYGDVDKLRNSFADNAYLYGDIKGSEYAKSLGEYLEGVGARKSPHDLQETNQMKVIGIEVLGNIALAKVHLPMLGYNYYDFLSLSLVDGEWKIVNKIFSHVE